ncbi:MAG: hypothetical protein IJ842_02700, partial [Bacilli bacterium]|nr:hypothetical protein [Bacilli bacterium]
SARLGSFKSTAKLLLSQAEKQYLVDQTLNVNGEENNDTTFQGTGNGDTECGKLAKLGSDYSACKITVNKSTGVATLVTLTGTGKFANYSCTNATLSNVDSTCNKSGSSESSSDLACSSEYCYLFGSYIKGEVTDYDIDAETCNEVIQNKITFVSNVEKVKYCNGETVTASCLTGKEAIDVSSKFDNVVATPLVLTNTDVDATPILLLQCPRSIASDIENDGAIWLESIGAIKNVVYEYNPDIKTDWKEVKDSNGVQRPVFLKFKNDLSEKYTCTTYNIGTGEPTCISGNVFNEYTNATDKTDTEWNKMITLFGSEQCNVTPFDVECHGDDSGLWSCYADDDDTSCHLESDVSYAKCGVDSCIDEYPIE